MLSSNSVGAWPFTVPRPSYVGSNWPARTERHYETEEDAHEAVDCCFADFSRFRPFSRFITSFAPRPK